MGFYIICIVVGLIVGLITVMVMKSQLNSVYMRDDAHAYIAADSLVLTRSSERFLYERTTRTAKPKAD